MNLPNKLTMARIILSPIFMVTFLINNLYTRYLALFIFAVAALTDMYDGHLARKTGVVTSFGKFMDPLADKLLTSTAFIAFVAVGYVKSWIVRDSKVTSEPQKGYYFFWVKEGDERFYVQTPIARTYIEEIK